MSEHRNDGRQDDAALDQIWYEAAFNGIVAAVVMLNAHGIILASNPGVERLFGYTSSETSGLPLDVLISDLSSGFQGAGERIRLPVGIDHEHRGMRKDGTTFPVRMDLSTFAHKGEQFFVAIIRDDTANKRAEEMQHETLMEALNDLEESQAAVEKRSREIETIIDTSVDAIAFVQPDGTFEYIDERFTEFFGISKDQIVGRNWSDMTPLFARIMENSADAFELLAGTAADDMIEIRETITQRWPDFRELDLQARPVKTRNGRHLGRLYVIRDITHEREVDRMKTQFVSMVSHELRTPLTSIKGFTEMILDEDFGEINEEQREFLGIVEANAERLIALVNDLLDISRIESGRVELKFEAVDIQEIVTIVVATMEHLIEEKSQTLELVVDPALPHIELDRDRIIQVLTNLVSNAYKYTPAGGHIRVSVERADGFVRFAVADNGFGISEQDQEKLFTRFFRVDNELTREIGGTGLGLNIVKKIVEMHGGAVTLDSHFGVGSTFAFTIPLISVEEEVTEMPEAPAESPVASKRTIWIVEDDADVALLIRKLLEKAGYGAVVYSSGEGAWKQLQSGADLPALITLDIELPGMNGFELAAKMASLPKTADIPLLVVSIYGDDPRSEKLGLVQGLTKPLDREQLLDKVSSLLGKEESEKTVLLIEADFQLQEELVSALQKQGFEVLQANEGQGGLKLALEDKPGLILLGMKLPDIDGMAVLRSLKQAEETADIPVIVSSAEGYQLSERARALALGAADYVTGPFDLDVLLEEIKLFMSDKED